MITDEWRKQNELLHNQDATYGSKGGVKHHKRVRWLMNKFGAKTVLDYGCGKGSLRAALGDCVRNYDPAIKAWRMLPEPADMVLCADVMEHIEPQFVDDVLEHIRGLTQKVAWFVIACRPATKNMPNGKNSHISVHPPEWWREKLEARFTLLEEGAGPDNDAYFLGVPK